VETGVNGTDQAQNNGFTITIKEFENLLKQHTSASGMPGRSLWDAFLKKLWDINSLDALHVFFDQRSNLLQKPKEEMAIDAEMGIPPPSDNMILLSRTSPFGAYVRRAKVEFARLQFHDAASLWKSFTAYRQVTLTTWRKRNPQTGPWAFDIVMEQADEVYGQDVAQSFYDVAYKSTASPSSEMTGLISTKDVERLLEFQIEQMQSTWYLPGN
jgi:anaphase-promoting complex subunit 5